jgi:hypothetical protein
MSEIIAGTGSNRDQLPRTLEAVRRLRPHLAIADVSAIAGYRAVLAIPVLVIADERPEWLHSGRLPSALTIAFLLERSTLDARFARSPHRKSRRRLSG